MPSYTPTQQQAVLCMLAYMSSFAEGSVAQLQTTMAEKLQLILSLHELQDLIGQWEIVWGPAIYQARNSDVADNTMFVTRCHDRPQLVVSIAGTNPYSWVNWLLEDLPVRKKEVWPTFTGNEEGLQPKISQGTANGLHILQKMEANEQTLVTFLQDYLSSQTESFQITVTGHSLGGALSPALAVYLADVQSTWDSANDAELSVMPIAGATAGNLDFALYGDVQLNGRIERIWNEKDVIPHAWDKTQMAKLPKLYMPTIKANWLVRLVIYLTRQIANRADYAHLQPGMPPLPGNVVPTEQALAMFQPSFFNKFLPKYLVQLGYQHFEAYYNLLQMDAFAQLMGGTLPGALSGPDLEELRRRVTAQKEEDA